MNVTVELKIKKGDDGYLTRVVLNGQPLGEDRLVTEIDLATPRLLIDAIRQLLRTPGPIERIEESTRAAGIELFHLWLGPVWQRILPALPPAGQTTTIAVASDSAELMLYPWETLLPPERDFLGLDLNFAIQRRALGMPPLNRCRALSPGPLRMVFMASTPEGFALPSAAWERELFAACLPDATDPAVPRIDARMVDTGDWEALRRAIEAHQPQVIHLLGPALIRGTQGFFAFEEPEDHQADARASGELVRELLRHSGAGLVILSGRETGKSPPLAATGALCHGIIATGEFPMALAWPESLAAPEAQPFFSALLTALASGERVDAALTRARRTIASTTTHAVSRPAWLLPTLYARGEQPHLFHAAFQLAHRTKWLQEKEE
ncbi:MAG: CHAT domain-containing protein [Magnetococcus sp. YQC-9]